MKSGVQVAFSAVAVPGRHCGPGVAGVEALFPFPQAAASSVERRTARGKQRVRRLRLVSESMQRRSMIGFLEESVERREAL